MTRKTRLVSLLVLGAGATACGIESHGSSDPGEEVVQNELSSNDDMLGWKINPSGFAKSSTPSGTVDTSNPFFQELGTNGRACVTCHQAAEGWTLTPWGVRMRFEMTGGLDPLFLPHDVANAPNLDVSTVEARRQAYSLMLERAVVRVGLPVKDTFEFELVAADDPYGWASATQLSLFRRPLPTTNLRFIGAVNWDGRSTPAADPTNIRLGLKNQSNGATVNHAKAPMPIADEVREAIVDFETSLTTAQAFDWYAGFLHVSGAEGGPQPLLTQPFSLGMNLPGSPDFTRNVFTLYAGWDSGWSSMRRARREIAAGQEIFNNRRFEVAPGVLGSCSGCHNTPNVGGASSLRLFDVGVSAPQRRAANMPLYTFRHKVTGETRQSTDPGRALITGLWADMDRFKVPGLRALAARAPYFHDGSARTLREVVEHYDRRFGMNLSWSEKRKLVRFLEAL